MTGHKKSETATATIEEQFTTVVVKLDRCNYLYCITHILKPTRFRLIADNCSTPSRWLVYSIQLYSYKAPGSR